MFQEKERHAVRSFFQSERISLCAETNIVIDCVIKLDLELITVEEDP